jgi:hypothetical protein
VGACKRVEPVLKQALLRYEGRFDVVILDVTDDDAIEQRCGGRGRRPARCLHRGGQSHTDRACRASIRQDRRPQGSLLEAGTFVRALTMRSPPLRDRVVQPPVTRRATA